MYWGEMPTTKTFKCYICKETTSANYLDAVWDDWNEWCDAHKDCEAQQIRDNYCSTHHVHSDDGEECPECEFDEQRGDAA